MLLSRMLLLFFFIKDGIVRSLSGIDKDKIALREHRFGWNKGTASSVRELDGQTLRMCRSQRHKVSPGFGS